ncbi:CG15912 [Drosophila busckii]|uniref:CG15912 n=2 Tax=Drosophila busckii TaxID=30019 RepID=A0A0M3QZ89_DROBS|nr:CG15912 [Drosophila busckii]
MSEQHSNFGCHTIGWQNWWRQLVINTFNCADATVPQDKLPAIAEHLLNVFRTSACWSHVDCAADLVQCVRGIGKSVGVISNFDASLPKVLKAMDFDDKFDFVLTSYEAGVMKPDPSIFEIPVKMLSIEPNQALHIGNKFDMDYIGARQSGWSSLLVQSQFEPATSEEARRHSYPSIAQMLYALEFEEINW